MWSRWQASGGECDAGLALYSDQLLHGLIRGQMLFGQGRLHCDQDRQRHSQSHMYVCTCGQRLTTHNNTRNSWQQQRRCDSPLPKITPTPY